jgi:hypothetical protein
MILKASCYEVGQRHLELISLISRSSDRGAGWIPIPQVVGQVTQIKFQSTLQVRNGKEYSTTVEIFLYVGT